MADVKKYLTGDTTGDEQVAEDDSSEEDNTGRIKKPQGRPVRERRPPEYLKDYGVYELCSVEENVPAMKRPKVHILARRQAVQVKCHIDKRLCEPSTT